MIGGRADSLKIKDGTLITFDEAVHNLSEQDLLFIRSSDGTDLPGLVLTNERGKPPQVSCATDQYRLEQVDDRTWRLRSDPYNR